MPNRKPLPRKKLSTQSRTARATVRQPSGPVLRLSSELDEGERNTFLAASGNQHTSDINERINLIQTGKRSYGLPYDVEEG